MMDAPRTDRVLLVIPTLGQRADLLREAVLSVLQQDGCAVDVVVVTPAGSPAERIAEEADIRVIADPGRGLSSALNAGLAAAPGDCRYFGWLGDDDLLRPGSLTAATTALRTEPNAVMVYGWCDYVNDAGETFFVSRAGPWAARVLGFGPDLVPQPGSLMRLSVVQRVGGLDESLKFAMDLDLFLKLRRHGKLLSIPRTLAAFRWHSESLTVANQRRSIDEADQVRRRHLKFMASATWPLWRWPMRWSLGAVKTVVKRRASSRSRHQTASHVSS